MSRLQAEARSSTRLSQMPEDVENVSAPILIVILNFLFLEFDIDLQWAAVTWPCTIYVFRAGFE